MRKIAVGLLLAFVLTGCGALSGFLNSDADGDGPGETTVAEEVGETAGGISSLVWGPLAGQMVMNLIMLAAGAGRKPEGGTA